MWHRTEWQFHSIRCHITKRLRFHLMLRESFGKQTSVHCKITKKRWIHAGRDRSFLKGYCSANDHICTSSIWSQPQCFLKRCHKWHYTSELINIYDLLEKCDSRLFTKIKNSVNHPLYALLPKRKEPSKKLRSQTSQLPRINKERFKNCYFNRIRFQYHLVI